MVAARLPQSKPAVTVVAPAPVTQTRPSSPPMRLMRQVAAAAPAVRLTPMTSGAARSGLPGPAAQAVSSPGAGDPLPLSIQRTLEHSIDVDLSSVRVHSHPQAASSLGARAFTYGTHIFLGKGERVTDLALMAHEVAHVVQQQGAPVLQMYSPAGTNRFEHEAERASVVAQRGERVTVQERTGGPQVQKVGLVERGEAWLRDEIMSLLETHAPDLVPILRQGVVEWLKERLGNAVQTLMDDISRPVRTIGDLVSSVRRHFANLGTWLAEAAAKIARGDCSSIAEAAEKIHQVFDALVAPVVERVKHYAGIVKGFFQGLWDRFGAPVWDFLRRIGGVVWDKIQQVGRWVWEKTKPVRDWLSRAWRWFKNWLGIGEGEEGQNGILQWIQRKAATAWEWVSARLAPYKRYILIAVGVLALLSPAGPLIVMVAAQAAVLRGIQWLRQNMRNRGGVLQGRTILRGVILPAILGAIDAVSGGLRSVANTITGAVTRLVGILGDIAATVSSTPILSFASGLVTFLTDAYRGLLTWAIEGVQGLATRMQAGLQRLGGYARMLVDFLERVARAVANVARFVYILGGRLWDMVPACVRDPFIDFFIPLILRHIPFFSELAATPEAWQQTRSQVTTIIRQVFRDFDLIGAMKSVFRLIVRILRIPVELAAQVLEKGAQAFDLVVAAPLRFIENSLKAILRGVGYFMRGFLSHLWFGVQGWLLNAIETSGTGIQPPATWDARGIFGFALDIFGISVNHVLDLLAQRIGRPLVDRLRQAVSILTGVWEWVKVALTEGVSGLWRMVQEKVGDLVRVVLDSAVGWVMTRIIAIVSARLTALAASAGLSGILEAVYAVYQAVKTAIEYARRILEVMLTVFTTIGQIATGVIDPAARGVERGMRMIMPVVIGFLANYAGLGGIGERIREIVMGIRARVDAAILALIDRALALGRAILDRLGLGQQLAGGRPSNAIGRVITFEAAGETHRLWLERHGQTVVTMMASGNGKPVTEHIEEANRLKALAEGDERASLETAAAQASAGNTALIAAANTSSGSPQPSSSPSQTTTAVDSAEEAEAEKMKILEEIKTQRRFPVFARRSDYRSRPSTEFDPPGPKFAPVGHRDQPYESSSEAPFQSRHYISFFTSHGLPAPSEDQATKELTNPDKPSALKNKWMSRVGDATSRSYAIVGTNPNNNPPIVESLVEAAVDPILKVVVTSLPKKILDFMTRLGVSGSVSAGGHTITRTGTGPLSLATMWETGPNRTWLADQFRDPSVHEWLPSDRVKAVIDSIAESQTPDRAILAGQLIGLIDDLRTPTTWLIFKDTKSTEPETIGQTQFVILQGHSGALYRRPGKSGPATVGQTQFHNDLRAEFKVNLSAAAIASRLETVFIDWIWNGRAQLPTNISPNLYHADAPDTPLKDRLGAFQSNQSTHYEEIKQHFARHK